MTEPSPTLADDGTRRSTSRSLARGFGKRCPRCGEAHLFAGYLKVADACGTCGQPFDGHRADDAPPYVTMMIVGHVMIVPLVEWKLRFDPSNGLMLLVSFVVATIALLTLLPCVKGALIGIQWAQRMHGFGAPDEADPEDILRQPLP